MIRTWIVILLLAAGCVLYPVTGANLTGGSIEGLNLTTVTELQESGFRAMEDNNWDELLRIADEGLAVDPNDPQMHSMKGYALRKLGNSQLALIEDSQAITIEPNPVRYANRGFTYISQGNYSAALADGESALNIIPDYSTGYALKSLAYLNLGNTTAAKENIDRALAIKPDSASHLHFAGIIAMEEGNCEDAIDYLNRSIAIDRNYSLPWPQMVNATVDLEKTRNTCKT